MPRTVIQAVFPLCFVVAITATSSTQAQTRAAGINPPSAIRELPVPPEVNDVEVPPIDDLATPDDMRDFAQRMSGRPQATPASLPAGRAPSSATATESTSRQPSDSSESATPSRDPVQLAPGTDSGNLWDRLEPDTQSDGVGITGSSWVFNTATALAMVVGLIFVLRWLYLRATGQRLVSHAGGVVDVLWRSAVSPRHHTILVRVGPRILLLGDSSNGLTTLAVIDEAEEVASLMASINASRSPSIAEGFTNLMHRFQRDERVDVTDLGADEGEFHVDRTRDEVGGLLARLRSLSSRGGAG